MKQKIKQIAKQAINLMPAAKWIAQDTNTGEWWAYEVEPTFNTTWQWWIPARISGYVYICTEKVIPNEPVVAYEISRIATTI